MPDFTEEEYLGAIFKLKVLALSRAPISSNSSFGLFNLGLCSKALLADKKKFRTISQVCPLDLDKTTEERTYGCISACAYFEHNYSVEQIHKLIEDFEIKD